MGACGLFKDFGRVGLEDRWVSFISVIKGANQEGYPVLAIAGVGPGPWGRG